MRKTFAALVFLVAAAAAATPAAAHDAPFTPLADEAARITTIFDRTLPNVPGKSLRAVLVEYGPGGGSRAHTHAPSAFIFVTVIEGDVRSQVAGEEARVYKAGDTFIELPGSHHLVSANASETAPSKHLAVFVVDTDDTVLTTPDAE